MMEPMKTFSPRTVLAVVQPDGNVHHDGEGAVVTQTSERKIMSQKICGFQSRKVAAFLAGLVTGVLIGGCSVFGPGLGVSVY